jgi:hypothetical protein
MKQMYPPSDLASMDPLVLMKNLDHVRMTSRRLSYILQQQVHLYTPEANQLREQIDRYVEAERQIESEMARRDPRLTRQARSAPAAPQRSGRRRTRRSRAGAASIVRACRGRLLSATTAPPAGRAARLEQAEPHPDLRQRVVAHAPEQAPGRHGAHLVVQLGPPDASALVAEPHERLGLGR